MGFWDSAWKVGRWAVPGYNTYLAADKLGLLPGGGDKGAPPDPNAWMYQGLGQYPTEMVTKGEEAIRQQTADWLKNAMQGINQQASSRGLDTTSFVPEQGVEAANLGSQTMATSLANLYGQAAQMQQQGKIAGAGMYSQAYQNWLTGMQQQQDDWIAGLMQMASMAAMLA